MAPPLHMNGVLVANPANSKDIKKGLRSLAWDITTSREPNNGAYVSFYEGTGGMFFELKRVYPKLGDAFPSLPGEWTAARIAYLRVLAGHRRRIKKELAAGAEPKGPQQSDKGRSHHTKDYYRYSLPAGGRATRRPIDSLKVCFCAVCETKLLGESEESYRASLISYNPSYARFFPPPVANRIQGRPLCTLCSTKIKA